MFVVVASAFAQSSGFTGVWTDRVPGLGEIRLTIAATKPDGHADGKMEFPRQSVVYLLGEKVDKTVAAVTMSGASMTIDTPAGGRYDLKLAGAQLAGTYTGNSGAKTAINFRK